MLTQGGVGGETIRFAEPELSVEPAGVISPLLEGNGRKGGELFAMAKKGSHIVSTTIVLPVKHCSNEFAVDEQVHGARAVTVGVSYNCVQPGDVTLTLTLPLLMHAPLTWSWKKSCGGLYRRFFAVSTWEKAVVRDGFACKSSLTSAAYRRACAPWDLGRGVLPQSFNLKAMTHDRARRRGLARREPG